MPAISRRGARLAYGHIFVHLDIWRMPAPGSAGTGTLQKPVTTATPFISSTRGDLSPQFSPDGKESRFGRPAPATQRFGFVMQMVRMHYS
jgi:hypothetical protein